MIDLLCLKRCQQQKVITVLSRIVVPGTKTYFLGGAVIKNTKALNLNSYFGEK